MKPLNIELLTVFIWLAIWEVFTILSNYIKISDLYKLVFLAIVIILSCNLYTRNYRDRYEILDNKLDRIISILSNR